MATRLLGPQLDIHCGGEDNIFPHHEAEIAQSECCTGLPFARYWLHCRHLLVDGQKMSKSLGNFYTLRDLLERGWSGREVRYALISVNYRLPLNFTMEGLAGARSALGRIDGWVERMARHAGGAEPEAGPGPEGDAFGRALDDDLNISAALGVLFDVVRATHRQLDAGELSPGRAAALIEWWKRADAVLALERPPDGPPAEVRELLERRGAARAAKDWAESDRLRDAVAALGWTVKDTKDGQVLTRV
jgi:cysteinyl-tRNA synthetase